VTRAWRQETVCLQIETIESSGRPSAFCARLYDRLN